MNSQNGDVDDEVDVKMEKFTEEEIEEDIESSDEEFKAGIYLFYHVAILIQCFIFHQFGNGSCTHPIGNIFSCE